MSGGSEHAHPSASTRAAILDRLPASAAVIGRDGRIEFVNRAWREFGLRNGRGAGADDVGRTTLDWGAGADGDIRAAVAGLASVIHGESSLFTFGYACHSAAAERWFECIVVPLERHSPRPVLSIHMQVGADTADRLRRAAGATTHRLAGLVMVCAWCAAKELSLTGDWVALDARQHAPAALSHGICPACASSLR